MGRYDILLKEDNETQQHKTVASPTRDVPAPSSIVSSVPARDKNTGRSPQLHQRQGKVSSQQPDASHAGKRPFVRRTFDFFEDQISYLTKVSLEDRLAGREGSMNAMIREAIDDYMKKRTAKK